MNMQKHTGFLLNLLLLSMLSLTGYHSVAQASHPTLKIMTYNIRYDNPGDGINSWSQRKAFVTSLIQFHGADVVCIQEGLIQQVRYLHDALQGFEYCGVGRDDGKEAGEFSAIFFRKEVVDLVVDSTFWLSLTPSVPSKGWDAALPRIVTWASFRVRATRQSFFVFNTHFDHIGQTARRESARLLQDQIRRIAGKKPALVAGDFNSTESDSAYRILIGPVGGVPLLRDSFGISRLPHHGVAPTFFGFDARTTDSGERIDFVFVSDSVTVLRHATLTDFRDGRFPSDHLPVLVELSFPD